MKNKTNHHATTEHVFDREETEFIQAMDEFQRTTGKRFPTLCETLGVFRRLGYAKRPKLVSMDEAFA